VFTVRARLTIVVYAMR
jgi:hypothetical protein